MPFALWWGVVQGFTRGAFDGAVGVLGIGGACMRMCLLSGKDILAVLRTEVPRGTAGAVPSGAFVVGIAIALTKELAPLVFAES